MRGYQSHIFHLEKKLPIKNSSNACFAVVIQYYENAESIACKLVGNKKFIYISTYTEKETEKYIPLLINIINKITTCKIVKFENESYIQFKLLNTYNQSLILLNFIRNLWYSVAISCYNEKIYNIDFFEILESSVDYKDPLERLTFANLQACKINNINRSLGHCNAHSFASLKIKKTKDLLEYKDPSTMKFLTT